MAYEDVVLADSPVAYWRLDDLTDASGGGLDLTATGTVSDVPSLLISDPDDGAKRLKSNVSNDGLVHAHAAILQPDLVTVEAWFKTDGDGALGAIEQHIAGKSNCYTLGIKDNAKARFEMWVHGAGFHDAEAADALSPSTVYHLVGTYDGADVRLYVNGELAATTAQAGVGAESVSNFAIGADVGVQNGCWGEVDEVAVYDEALSEARIAAHYAAGVGSADSTPPVATVTGGPSEVDVDQATTTVFEFRANEDIQAWEVQVVPDHTAGHDDGVVIGTSNGSLNVTGGGLPALTPQSVTIHGADLDAASPGAGAKVIKVFVQDLAGNWSAL